MSRPSPIVTTLAILLVPTVANASGLPTTLDQSDLTSSAAVEAQDGFGRVLAKGDFDGDDLEDLVIGTPEEDIGAAVDAGAVFVVYGDGDHQTWHQNVAGVPGQAEAGDRFGYALAAGDFDGDGRSDLAIGIPGENDDAGAVYVLYGSASGLSTVGDELWDQEDEGVYGASEPGDQLGYALAAGDLRADGDRTDDLVIGSPGEDDDAGAVRVLWGVNEGLASDWDYIDQDTPNVAGSKEAGDRFGAALALIQFRGFMHDLVVGVPGEDDGAGAVNVLEMASSLTEFEGDLLVGTVPSGHFGATVAPLDTNLGFQLAVGAPGAGTVSLATTESGADLRLRIARVLAGDGAFGTSLASAEDTLVVGAPDAANGEGRVHVYDVFVALPGSIYQTNMEVPECYDYRGCWHVQHLEELRQGSSGFWGTPESGDQFGFSLLIGDFGGARDLVVGVPLEDLGSVANAGYVQIGRDLLP